MVTKQTAHVNLVHDGGEAGVFGVDGVDGGDGVVKVLDVLGVHLEEGGEADDHVSDAAAVLKGGVPRGEPLAELE